jgi:DNA-binding NarL/FixJ family response regulator
LRNVLHNRAGFQIVLETSDARSFLQNLGQVPFDVVIVDIALPGSNGIALVRELRRRGLLQPVVLLSMHPELDMVVQGMLAGARGYVVKTQPTPELCDAIRVVLDGERYLPPHIDAAQVEALLRRRKSRHYDDSPMAMLSPREREVFDLLIRGFNNGSIARELCISAKTVETHREHILAKLGMHSIVELVRLAARHNLLTPALMGR